MARCVWIDSPDVWEPAAILAALVDAGAPAGDVAARTAALRRRLAVELRFHAGPETLPARTVAAVEGGGRELTAAELGDAARTDGLGAVLEGAGDRMVLRLAEAGRAVGVPADRPLPGVTGARVLCALAASAALEALGGGDVLTGPLLMPPRGASEDPARDLALALISGVPVRFAPSGAAACPAGIAWLLAAGRVAEGVSPAMLPERVGRGVVEGGACGPVCVILAHAADAVPTERAWVVEVTLDDMTGQALGLAMERVFEAGAVDVFFTPVQMKKGRPGTVMTAMCLDAELPAVESAVLKHTTTFGLRRLPWERRTLGRDHVTVETPWGSARVKRGFLDGRLVRWAPEYEDCRRLAEAGGVSLEDVRTWLAARAPMAPGRDGEGGP